MEDRRPIPARDLTVSRAAARWLAGAGVLPDAISVVGLLCGAGGGLAMALTASATGLERPLWLLAALLVPLRLIANMLDGMVAEEGGRGSPLGMLFNEVPDRISDAATLIGLGYALDGSPTLGYLAALGALFTAYVRAAGRVAGAPQDFRGPMAKQQRMMVVLAVALFYGLAPTAWRPTLTVGVSLTLPMVALLVVFFGCVLTSARRLRWIAGELRAGRSA